jgi:hypothetical protein
MVVLTMLDTQTRPEKLARKWQKPLSARATKESCDMMCIEFLILRTPSKKTADAVTTLVDVLKDMKKPTSLVGCWILRHGTFPGDVALMLQWKTAIGAPGSALAQQLKPLLLDLGIVNYSVWVEEESTTS